MADLNPNYDEPKYPTLCGTVHVIKVAHLIGIIGLILSLASFLLVFTAYGIFGQLSAFIHGCFWLLIFIPLVCAKGKRKPWLYLPFLTVQGIGVMVLWLVEFNLISFWLWFALLRLLGFEGSIIVYHGNTIHKEVQVAALGLLDVSFILLGTTVVLTFSDWILLVVIRAFEFTFTCELLNPLVPTYEPGFGTCSSIDNRNVPLRSLVCSSAA